MFDDTTSYGLLKKLENNPALSQRDLENNWVSAWVRSITALMLWSKRAV